MILQALVKYYEDLLAAGEIAPAGWAVQKVSFAAHIDDDGKLERITSLKIPSLNEKKPTPIPQSRNLPAPVKRTVNCAANFLWDNSTYIFGFDSKDKPERAQKCFEVCREFHEKLLRKVDLPAAKALLRFFASWDPAQAETHPALQAEMKEILKGGNIVFRYRGEDIHDIPAIRQIWQEYYETADKDNATTCLVTGRTAPIAVLHPSIKGIVGAQPSGASLVSFNASAFCSYGHGQGFNAPTSEYAAFAYSAALNYLIADREHVQRIGDTTVLCWADGGEKAYQSAMMGSLFGADTAYTQEEIAGMVKLLAQGKSVLFDETNIDPNRTFYILGLAPNAARLSVRFFLRNSFGNILKNVQEHQQRLEISRTRLDPFATIPLWRLLSETVNQKAKDKAPSPKLAGEVLRAIISGDRYPATLLNGITLRIRADHIVNRNRAAILKAYYLKNKHPDVPEEVLTVALNPNSTSVPYQLGRMFSVLEDIQKTANSAITTTIKDKYFNAASSTPAVVFPTLINLAQKHLRKIGGGLQVTLERQFQEIADRLPEEFPKRLSLPEQGAFQLGYYQQTVARYQRVNKEEK